MRYSIQQHSDGSWYFTNINQNEVVHQHKPLTEEERIAFRQLQKASKGEPWLAENKQKSSAIALGDQEQGDEQKGAGGSTGSESKVVSSTKSADDAEFKNDRGQCRIDERRRNTEDNRKSPVDDSSRSGTGPSKSGRRDRSDPREAVTQFAELLFAFFLFVLIVNVDERLYRDILEATQGNHA